MFNRAFISVFKRKGKSTLMLIVLFLISVVVLSSISILNATEAAEIQARESLGSEVTLEFNTAGIREYMQALRESGEEFDRSSMDSLFEDVTSTLAFEIASNEYVDDFNMTVTSQATPVDFYLLDNSDELIIPEEEEFVTEEEEVTEGPMQDSVVNITLTGTYNITLLDSFVDGTLEIVEGTSFTGSDDNKVIMSSLLASSNGLSVGDYITIENETETVELEIVGLYESDDELVFGNRTNPTNNMYVSFNDALLLNGQTSEDEFTINSATYYINDPLNVETFIEDVTDSVDSINDGTFSLNANDEEYEAMLSPIENLGSFTNIILIVVVLGSVMILSLIITINTRERKYEIGVLLSLGEEKLKVVSQYVLEVIMLAVLAITLSFGVSQLVAQELGDTLLTQQLESEEEDTQIGSGGMGMMMPGTSDVDVIDEIDVSVSLDELWYLSGITVIIIVVSSALPMSMVMRYQPKTILSNRS